MAVILDSVSSFEASWSSLVRGTDQNRGRRHAGKRTVDITRQPGADCAVGGGSLTDRPQLSTHDRDCNDNDDGDEQPWSAPAPWRARRDLVRWHPVLIGHCVWSFTLRFCSIAATGAVLSPLVESSNPPPSTRTRSIESDSSRDLRSASRLCCASSGCSAE